MTRVRIGPPRFPFGFHGHTQFMGPGPGGHGAGLFFLLILAALVVLVVLLFTRHRDRDGGHVAHGTHVANDALRILNERLARGEIEPEDYSTRRSLLQGPT